ncbi:NAD(P)H-binding protein [Streptomyces olivochromogenes]|uniref:NAD(P)H-binding protein n=1 Tax=Streptomyces olivochromogenes TaxID=1963 RepID=UPI001F316894|nr:NAD(P)H-binding protein [Streptomyces olivochromogenes]MCF3131254.1 NAD(P)H-binding protein [Streptomyces olivochromogenes]
MTVLVTGSRGKVGSQLARILREQGVPVRAGSADPGKLSLPEGVQSVRLALDEPATFAGALDGIDSVFLYCEAAHIDAFVAEAEAAGVGHVVVMSADAVLRPDAETNPIAAPHLVVERALAASSLTSTALNCGALASNAAPWAFPLRTQGVIPLPYPDSYADPVNERDIAECAHAVLTRPELRGRSYHLTGPAALSFREEVAVIAEAVGRDIPVRPVPPQVWRANKPDFMPDDIAGALLELWAASTEPVPLSTEIETLTGHPARPFSEWAKENAAAFAA